MSKVIQIAVMHDGGPNGADVLENYVHEQAVPFLSRAMDVTIDGALYTVWKFDDVRSALRVCDEFNGIDISTLSEAWRKANAFRLSTLIADED